MGRRRRPPTISHNVRLGDSSSNRHLRQDVLSLDMDLAFGTAGLKSQPDRRTAIAPTRSTLEKKG